MQHQTPEEGRWLILDYARAAAIVLMIVYHSAYDAEFLFGMKIGTQFGVWKLIQKLCASLFLVIHGISFTISWQKKPCIIKVVKRSVTLIFCASIVTVSTYLFDAHTFVRFGILHLIAVSSVIIPAISRLSIIFTIIVGLVIVGFRFCINIPGSTMLVPFGFPPSSFISIDYFPFIPWLGVIILGVALGKYIIQAKGFTRQKPTKVWSKVCVYISKKSLLIYMIHQPIILAIFQVIHVSMN